ncbi:MAG: hypothetical protein DMF77_24010 [Acidobacteria bacterium]|nr:MAG: hypothetical protein DMF77_24010 [Acidobacteriota bacterium]
MDWSTGTTLLTIVPLLNVRRRSVWSDWPVGTLSPSPSATLLFLHESGLRIHRRAVSPASLSEFERVTERSMTRRLASRMGLEREAMKYGRLTLRLVRWVQLYRTPRSRRFTRLMTWLESASRSAWYSEPT